MAKKSTTTETKAVTVEEATAPVIVENVTPETVNITEAKAEPIKRVIIANSPTPFRKTTSLEPKYIVGQMPVGVAYEIITEKTSKIYGDFYQLNNGYYITKSGNFAYGKSLIYFVFNIFYSFLYNIKFWFHINIPAAEIG